MSEFGYTKTLSYTMMTRSQTRIAELERRVDYIMGKQSYIATLLEQDDLTICPECSAAGKRQPLCRNAVLNRHDTTKPFNKSNVVLCCCWLGNEDETGTKRHCIKIKVLQEVFGKRQNGKFVGVDMTFP